MKKLFSKIFGGSSAKNEVSDALNLVGDVLQTIVDKSGLALSFDVERDDNDTLHVEIFGEDEELLTAKEGQLIDAFQLYLKRVVQHQLPEDPVRVFVDSDGFREQANQSLIELAEKLKGIAVSRGKPVYFRALPPRDRKVIHQYLAEDGRVKSRSVGDGLYKKIKIFPVKNNSAKKVPVKEQTV